MTVAALIVAAGRGARAGGGDIPKQYVWLCGAPVLVHAARPFLSHPRIDLVQVVIGARDGPLYRDAVETLRGRLLPPVTGGETRQSSVFLGLKALSTHAPDRVLIHDAARPLISKDVIGGVIDALDRHQGAIAAEPMADTLKRVGEDGVIAATVSREGLWRAQTPQGFHFAPIFEAHRRADADRLGCFTDDAALAAWAGMNVTVVQGSPGNIKITSAEDLAMADRLLAGSPPMEPRTGSGFDVHRLAPGDHVWLCGVRIPHTHRLEGHSDADVGLHALTDALLGAIGDGDIGEHFPPSEARWKGAASSVFVRDAAARVAARDGRILNVDITLLCEAPKIAPYRAAMRAAIAELLALDAGRVSVKATTMETLGFVGRREGIAAMAAASVLLPP